ncbi:hypothetical protein ENUP19_0002G0054 [Entamoeba nuttalli]|uniref:Uncharacterized protein n=2 Tax=Entamoeba nuttalli TaxID=412467 RepID=K2H4M0_ENTNP|nr:hypothetical protein ENU1_197750 [Entamoeba nuttalli P19]EKE37424.1 hypothetical protein ENU1_197750 [Entamoeba nuttalli P19]|eukprot:XP_008860233.1 hypothetical protein ENU1_197750 [Entamoeba nuttalli P19]
MSQSVEVGNINQILVIGKNSFLSINSTTVTLWDSNTAQSLKTIMIPPGITIVQAVSISQENEFSLYVLTSSKTIIQFTKPTFDYSKAKVYQSGSPVTKIAVIDLNTCLISKQNEIGTVNFNKEVVEYTELFKVKEEVTALLYSSPNIYLATKFELFVYSMEGKEIKKISFNENEIKQVVSGRKKIFVICDKKLILINEDLTIGHEFIGDFYDLSENEDFILVSGSKQTELISSQYNSALKTYKTSQCCGINNKIILYSNNLLEFIDLPMKPTLSDCLKHISNGQTSIECDVNNFVGSSSGEYQNEVLNEENGDVLPNFDVPSDEDFIERIESAIKMNGNLRWNLWDEVHKRIQEKKCSTDVYWSIILKLIIYDLIRDYTDLLLLLIHENNLNYIDYIIQRDNVTVTEVPLLSLLRITVKMNLNQIEFNNKDTFILHVFDREINAQTAPKMLSQLNPNEVMNILKYLIQQFESNTPISQQRILNWLMAFFDAHITLLITDQQFTAPLKQLFAILQKEIQLSENCEALKPYIEQIKFNLPLPTVNTDEYVVIDLLYQ